MLFIFISDCPIAIVKSVINPSFLRDYRIFKPVFSNLPVVVPSCPLSRTPCSPILNHQCPGQHQFPQHLQFIQDASPWLSSSHYSHSLTWFLAPPATSLPFWCQTQANPPQLRAHTLLDDHAFLCVWGGGGGKDGEDGGRDGTQI